MRVLKMVKPLGACSKSQPVLKITADKWHLPAQTAEALRSAPFRAYQLRISSCTESCLHHFQTTRRFHLFSLYPYPRPFISWARRPDDITSSTSEHARVPLLTRDLSTSRSFPTPAQTKGLRGHICSRHLRRRVV